MSVRANDTQIVPPFPSCPVAAGSLLVPITSWPDMFRETEITGVEFSEFWYESVEDRVAYFFRWLGEPRATVLAIWESKQLTFVECRKSGDVPVSALEAMPIVTEVIRAFQSAGFSVRHNPSRWIGPEKS